MFSVALSLGSPPPGVIRHRTSVEPGLSSPRASAEGGHPAVWQHIMWAVRGPLSKIWSMSGETCSILAPGREAPDDAGTGLAMASDSRMLTIQFLEWLAARSRRYAEIRAAWTSTCPSTCAWEDAVSEDLVRHRPDGTVTLTARGRERLDEASRSGAAGVP